MNRRKRQTGPVAATVMLTGHGTLQQQVYDALRNGILEGAFPGGSRLPSSRELATGMGISRNSVLIGIERLTAEGYLLGRRGSGTFVTDAIPDDLVHVRSSSPRRVANQEPVRTEHKKLSRQAQRLASLSEASQVIPCVSRPFPIGIGPIDLFPYEEWGRLLGRSWRKLGRKLGDATGAAGLLELRNAICMYIKATRGVTCRADQVLIVNGTQQALTLAAQVLLNPGDDVWFDEPGYDGARGAFTAVGTKIRPIRGDREGMDVSVGIKRWPNAKMVFTAPSHQFPLGGTMSLSRRLELLEWAGSQGAWIFEDDYNSEFRYAGRPIQALQGLDRHERVIYAGTFSKIMYPGLRLGFVVAPDSLIRPLQMAKHYSDTRSSVLEQATLAEFIESGRYARHVRRVRRACQERKQAIVDAIQRHLPHVLDIEPTESGIHLVCWIAPQYEEKEILNACAKADVQVQSLSRYCLLRLQRPGILLGYGAHPPNEILTAIQRIARWLPCPR